jgi:hypothetical protein
VEFLPDSGHAVPSESGETMSRTTPPEPLTGLQGLHVTAKGSLKRLPVWLMPRI